MQHQAVRNGQGKNYIVSKIFIDTNILVYTLHSKDSYKQAKDMSVILQLSFWDSLIVAAAEKSKCEYIISEDLNLGQTYRGVMVINPFQEDAF